MSYNTFSQIIVGVIAICLWRWMENKCKPANDEWHLYPDDKPSVRSWYYVTVIEKFSTDMDEYITYSTCMYYLGDGIWINRTVQSISEQYDFIKTNGEIGIHNANVMALYTIRDLEPNPYGKRIVAWKNMGNVYIKPGINYYGTSNRCDIYPDALNK